jgi:HEAT repeat protein
MGTTRKFVSLTGLTTLILACALACLCAVVTRAQAKRADDAATLLAALREAGDGWTPNQKRARDEAVESLKRMGGAAAPSIREFIKTEKGPARGYAAVALAGIDPEDALARRALDDVARKGKGDVVIEVAAALAEVDPEDDAAVPELVKMASKSIFLPSAKKLRQMRGSAQALALTAKGVRALTPLLNHWDSWVRQSALYAFDERTETLKDASPATRAAVGDAVPALVKNLADGDELTRELSAEVLEQLGPVALPELKKAAASGDRKLAAAAAELLKQLGRS